MRKMKQVHKTCCYHCFYYEIGITALITTTSLALLSPIVLSCNQHKIRRITESAQNDDSVWDIPVHF